MKSFTATKNAKISKLALEIIPDLTYSALMKAFRKKDVKVNGKRVNLDVCVSTGDFIEIYYTVSEIDKFSVVFCDQNILVINKKRSFSSDAVFNSVKEKYSTAKYIHRLDTNTDGIMLFALNEIAEKELLLGFKNRTFDKKYHALVVGEPKVKSAILNAYLLKDKENSLVKIFDKKVAGSTAIKTGYKVLFSKGNESLLEVTLYTGKTHQIRAHLAHIGHPIIGDGKYGDYAVNKAKGQEKQNLTAYQITLNFEKGSMLYYLNGRTFSIE